MSFKTHLLTKITGLFILSVIIFTIVSQQKWEKDGGVIGADVRGYYAYLPALFIHDDLKFENKEVYKIENGYSVWLSVDENEQPFVKYTSGMSIMYSPFFLAAHGLAESLGAKPDGFSWPYKVGLIIGSLFYLLIGIIFLSKLLLRYFEDRVVSVALLILYLGTNLFEFETGLLAYSHAYSFALIALFLFCTVKWLDAPKLKWAVWMGISGGLIFLIRPIDIIFLSFVFLFNVNSFRALKERFELLWKHKKHVLIFAAFFVLMLVPQLLYFKHVFGHFIYYSYTKEGFFFLHPHLFDALLSYRNGWLVYSPVLVFALLGFFFTKRYSKQFTWFSLFAFLMYFYVISSWWCWWYAGFGNRAFINAYPVLSIPLCAFIAFVFSKKELVQIGFQIIVLALIVLNVFQSYQFEKGIIHWGFMSKDAYWDSFGRTERSQLQQLYLEPPHLDKALLGRDVVSVSVIDTLWSSVRGFEHIKSNDSLYYSHVFKKESFLGKSSLYFHGDPYAMNNTIDLPKGTSHVYLSVWVKAEDEIRFVLVGDESTPFYQVSDEIESTRKGWQKLHLFAKLPRDIDYEQLDYYLWNDQMVPFLIDDLEVRCFDVKIKIIEK